MGCSAAKNLTVEPLEGVDEKRRISVPKSITDIPPLEGEEPQTEMLKTEVNNLQKGSNGLSFEIAFPEEDDESIIKKHPPKRLQRLEEEQQAQPPLTLEILQEKLDDAEVRRQQFLHQRIQSSKNRISFKASQDDVEGDPYLKVPPPDIDSLNGYNMSKAA